MWRSQLGGVRSLWRSGAREPGWLIGGTLTAIGYAVIATSVIFRLFAIELGYFWQQDYGWMSRAAQADLGVGGAVGVVEDAPRRPTARDRAQVGDARRPREAPRGRVELRPARREQRAQLRPAWRATLGHGPGA